jgi:hypothetical protein
MKISVDIKDPDVFSDAVDEAVKKDVASLGLSTEEAESVAELRAEKVNDFMSRWVEYGEYIRVEFDTDAGTAVVVPVKR